MILTSDRILSGVRELRTRIAECALETERARRLPRALVEQLRTVGVFRMLVPESHGGSALDVVCSSAVLAELATADAAAGWIAMIGCHAPLHFSRFERVTFDTIYADGPDVIAGGSSAPKGLAERVAGGYQVSGRWTYASGCEHADWMFSVCAETEGGEPVVGPEPGSRSLVFIVLPAVHWQIFDTWNVAGLRGTGSHDIGLTDEFVPVERAVTFAKIAQGDSRSGGLFMAHHQMYLHVAAVAVGIAQGAVNDLIEIGKSTRRRLYTRGELGDAPAFQHRLGMAEADVQAARAFLFDVAERLWKQVHSGHVEEELAARVPQVAAWIAETCAGAVESCFRAAGAPAVQESSPLQRRLRDVHTLTQHILVQESSFASVGAMLVGRAPVTPLLA